ncbi:FtsX-like permease family protein [Streptococcus sp. 20-1249]|uniref:FtsX-like permease family protein n=1 Tax=Streptococcus hepaticus TaxID=3349163 RepID=UPI00374A7275
MKKVYWKNLAQSIWSSKGRFFSIFSLMFIGAVTLVGLKVTSPNMEQSAQSYIDKTQMMDLAVIAEMGLDKQDQAELNKLKNATVEYAYMTDVTRKGTTDAIRIYSQTKQVSLFQLESGSLPTQANEIALATILQKDYQIGDLISFTQADDGVLKETTFRVTGFVHSSEMWSTKNLGNSSAGAGNLSAYAVTTPSAFDSDVYMIARIRYEDLKAVGYTSVCYDERLAQHQEELEKRLSDNGKKRLTTVRTQGQKEIAQGQGKIADAEKELRQAGQQLSDGEQELTDGENQLSAAQAQLADSQDQVQISRDQLARTAAALASKKAELDTAKVRLDQTHKLLQDKRNQLDEVKMQLARARENIAQKQVELDTTAGQIQSEQATLETAKHQLQEKMDAIKLAGEFVENHPEIQAEQAKLAQEELFVQQALKDYNKGFLFLEEAKKLYQEKETNYQLGESQYAHGLAHYQDSLAAYESGLSQYQAGEAAYQAGIKELQSAQSQLEQAQANILDKEKQLDQSKTEIAEGKENYAKEKRQADQQLSSSKKELTEAENQLKQLEEPSYNIYNRKTIPGGTGYENYRVATGSISAVGTIFPLVLYLVAAMVTFTTMTRFVDEERTNAGIFKALGYTNRDIIRKFVLYGFLASCIGTIVGVLAGSYWLSPIISRIITEQMVLGDVELHFYPVWLLVGLLLGFLSAILPAFLVAYRELKENAAQLLLPKPPVSGSTILLEKISFIWKRLTFTQKVTARNIFRYKQRMFMTMFGVAGSVALLFAGLGIRSSISGLVNRQFGDLLHYDMIVVKNTGASQSDLTAVEEAMQSKEISSSLALFYQSLEQSIPHHADKQTISLIVTDQSEKLDAYLSLVHRQRKEPLVLTDKGAILTEKLAKLYEAKVGDTVQLTLDRENVSVKVAGIAEMYAGHSVYMTADYYKKVTGTDYPENAWLLRLKHTRSSAIKKNAAQFLGMTGVSAVVQNTTMISTIEHLAQSLQSIMLILIILSVLLAIVILYNLTNINVAERIRELSTIKVLGFHNKEVTLYIYRETILLSFIGILLGLLGGIGLHLLILNMIGTDSIVFNPSVTWDVYLTPILVIFSILAVLGWFVNHHLRKVDMLEALKSIE